MPTSAAFDLSTALIEEQFRLELPSALEWIGPTVGFLKERAVRIGVCDEERGLKLELALHEALTNSVIHGNLEVSSQLKERGDDSFALALAERGGDPAYNSRTVSIGVEYDGGRCRWTLTDEGPGFDVEEVLRRLEPTDENLSAPSGRGILMMRAFLDDVRYEDGGRRVVLTMDRASKKDQRRHPRVPDRRPVRVAPIRADGSVDWEAAREGLTRDFSGGGVAVLQEGLARVDRIIIGLDLDGRPVYIPAEIRHWKPLDAGLMEIGCRFLTAQEAEAREPVGGHTHVGEAVDELLRRLEVQDVPEDERRAHPRVSYTERIGLSGPTESDPRFAYARDLSRGGIAFITTAPVTQETKVLTLPREGAPPMRIRARVVRCAAVAEGFYDVGACFEGLEG
jgi:anti-sigma regulatory factor (Ser/Thr protein kinase)